MRTGVFFLALGLAALALAQDPKLQLTQAEAAAAVNAIVPELQSIRGLNFKTKVPVTVIDDRRAREYALARFRKMTPETQL